MRLTNQKLSWLIPVLAAGSLCLCSCSNSQPETASILPEKSQAQGDQKHNPSETSQSDKDSTEPDKPKDTENPYDQASIGTYSNGKYGFLLDMPPGWQFGEETPDGSQVSITGRSGETARAWGEENSAHLADGNAVCNRELAKNENKNLNVKEKKANEHNCFLKLTEKTGKLGKIISIYVGSAYLNGLEVQYSNDVNESVNDAQLLEVTFLPGGLTPR